MARFRTPAYVRFAHPHQKYTAHGLAAAACLRLDGDRRCSEPYGNRRMASAKQYVNPAPANGRRAGGCLCRLRVDTRPTGPDAARFSASISALFCTPSPLGCRAAPHGVCSASSLLSCAPSFLSLLTCSSSYPNLLRKLLNHATTPTPHSFGGCLPGSPAATCPCSGRAARTDNYDKRHDKYFRPEPCSGDYYSHRRPPINARAAY